MTSVRRGLIPILLAAGVVACVTAAAQTPAPSVTTSFGVDTSITEVRDIVRLTRAYLANPDTSARSKGLWSRSSLDARYGDLAAEVYQGFPATIVGVTGTGPGDSVFVVKIIHGSADSTGTRLQPIALQRIYAVRAPGSPYGWQLSAPLPRLTRYWIRRDSGRITYWYAPGQVPSPTKAARATAFIDSVAKLFDVRPPSHLDAYVTATMDEGQRLFGLDFFVENSGPGTGLGGRGGGPGILILSNPKLGEAYLHELVHAVLGPTVEVRNPMFGEGVATWLGGSGGRSLPELYAALRQYQQAHPSVSLTELLQSHGGESLDAGVAFIATRALIIDSIYRSYGVGGLKEFAKIPGPDTQLIKVLPKYIKGMDEDPNRWWREETERVLKGERSRERRTSPIH